MQCDICSSPGTGTIVATAQFSGAVRRGFNPFAIGCIPEAWYQNSAPGYYERWAQSAMYGNTSRSDWNVCSRCMGKLNGYLQAERPTIPAVKPVIEPVVGSKPIQPQGSQPKAKRWWEFWR